MQKYGAKCLLKGFLTKYMKENVYKKKIWDDDVDVVAGCVCRRLCHQTVSLL